MTNDLPPRLEQRKMGQTSDCRKPASHLINILKTTAAHHPNFTLFIGAGASAQSGVKTAKDMIRDWQEHYWSSYGSGSEKTAFLGSQPWFEKDDEYALLFEALYDQPSLRREYIETCLEHACPSWGYIYLVRLLEKGVFNTVFTTNFDDLLNESCYLFSSNVRPIVCAQDSSIRSMRITSKRPKIIKLHGDFLFDSIKNTLRELESLESNMRDKFRQYAGEFGMIFVGYSGRDRSIMDTLDALLRAEANFPHGIYWCVRYGAELPEKVDLLRRFPKFHVVEISSFDEFFASLHASMELGPHPLFDSPYTAVSTRLQKLLQRLPIPSGDANGEPFVIERDLSRLGRSLIQGGASATSGNMALPYGLLTAIERKNGRLDNARQYAIQYLDQDDGMPAFTHQVRLVSDLLWLEWNDDLWMKLSQRLTRHKLVPMIAGVGLAFDIVLALIKWRRFSDARGLLEGMSNIPWLTEELEEFYFINLAQVSVHEGSDISPAALDRLTGIAEKSASYLSRFGANAVLRRDSDAMTALRGYMQSGKKLTGFTPPIAEWPVSALLGEAARNELAELACGGQSREWLYGDAKREKSNNRQSESSAGN